MSTINEQILSGEIDLFKCDGWSIEGSYGYNKVLFKGEISIEDDKAFVLSNQLIGAPAKNCKGYECSYLLAENGRIVPGFVNFLNITRLEIKQNSEPLINADADLLLSEFRKAKERQRKASVKALWEQRRYELAKSAMVELMNYEYYSDDRDGKDRPNSGLLTNRKAVCACAISYADEMIEQLKQK